MRELVAEHGLEIGRLAARGLRQGQNDEPERTVGHARRIRRHADASRNERRHVVPGACDAHLDRLREDVLAKVCRELRLPRIGLLDQGPHALPSAGRVGERPPAELLDLIGHGQGG